MYILWQVDFKHGVIVLNLIMSENIRVLDADFEICLDSLLDQSRVSRFALSPIENPIPPPQQLHAHPLRHAGIKKSRWMLP